MSDASIPGGIVGNRPGHQQRRPLDASTTPGTAITDVISPDHVDS